MILNIVTKAQSTKEIMEGKITMVRAKLNTILIHIQRPVFATEPFPAVQLGYPFKAGQWGVGQVR